MIFIQQRNIKLNRLLEMLHLEETFKNIFWWNAIRHGMKVYKLLTMDEILLPNSRSWYMILKGLLPFPWWSQRLVYNTHMKKVSLVLRRLYFAHKQKNEFINSWKDYKIFAHSNIATCLSIHGKYESSHNTPIYFDLKLRFIWFLCI